MSPSDPRHHTATDAPGAIGRTSAASGRLEAYIRDVEFPSTYIHGQAPVRMSCAAAMGGFGPPSISGEYAYCELGSSTGATLNLLAAANPQATFHGVDFNAGHIRRAQAAAKGASLENVTFVQASFDDLAECDLPQFDFISIQGTYSWLEPDIEAAIRRFVGGRLRPGGLFYIDYMSMPGKAAIAPLWLLVRTLTSRNRGDPVKRAEAGMALLEDLLQQDAGYMQANPPARQVLVTLLHQMKSDPAVIRRIAHHALAEGWRPRYFTEVAAELESVDLRYAGTTNLAMNIANLAVPASMRPILERASDPASAELLKDFLLNRQQRQDVFIKDREADAAGAARFLRSSVFIVPLAAPTDLRRQLESVGEHTYDTPLYEAMFAEIERGAASLEAIEHAGALDPFEADDVLAAYRRLLASNAMLPCAREPDADQETDASVLLSRGAAISARINRMLLKEAVTAGAPVTLTSPIAGGGCVTLNIVEAALLSALADSEPAKAAQRAKRRLRTVKTSITMQGRSVRANQIDQSGLSSMLQQMQRGVLPFLLRMGLATARTSSSKSSSRR